MTRLARGVFLGGKPVLASSQPGALWNPLNPDYTAGSGSAPTAMFPSSPWTYQIPATPTLAGNSAALVTNLTTGMTNYGGSMTLGAGASRYVVHGKQLAWQTMQVNPADRWGPAPVGSLSVPFGPSVLPGPASDYQVVIWDVDNETVGAYTGPMAYNYWVENPNLTCNTFNRQPTDGSYTAGFGAWAGEPTALTTTTAASGCNYGAGLITVADWVYGSINHALMLTVGWATGTPVAPATSSDGSTSIASGGIPEGTLYFFKSTVNPSQTGWSAFESMVFAALKAYGMYAVDQDGGYFSIAMENPVPWQAFQGFPTTAPPYWPVNMSAAYNAFPHIPWSSLSVLTPGSN